MTAREAAAGNGGRVAYLERHVATADGELYARDYPGSGPAFVMLHGFPDNLRFSPKSPATTNASPTSDG